jgi:hypothetical protein
MAAAPTDLTPFQEVNEKLSDGRSAPHTPSGTYRESRWPIELSGRRTTLVWPDYSGEQIDALVSQRQLSESWVARLRESAGWLIFLRMGSAGGADNVLQRPRAPAQLGVPPEQAASPGDLPTPSNEPTSDEAEGVTGSGEIPVSGRMARQAELIELFQALLFVRQVGTHATTRQPPVVVLLSCWDEIPDNKVNDRWLTPQAMLTKRWPLFSQYLSSTWHPSALRIMGLSSLGRALRDDVSDEDFIDEGPERQGWCIQSDGTQLVDLTEPVRVLLDLVDNPLV